jgi:CRP-like cAMP-binding protein
MVSVDDLARLPLFASIEPSGLEAVAPLFEKQDVSEGIELMGEGASGYKFFILCDGCASVSSHDHQVAELHPGDFFGEGAILSGARRNATVTTTEPSKVLVMFGTEFRRLEMTHPEIAEEIQAVMRARLAA